MLIPQTDRQTDRQREAPTAANQEIDTLVTQRILSEITGVKKKEESLQKLVKLLPWVNLIHSAHPTPA